jgi:hypothetical protein
MATNTKRRYFTMHSRFYPLGRVLQVVLGTFIIAALAVPASAGPGTLYDNGPINGTATAFTINYGYQVADSFTLAGNSTLTEVNFGVWMFPGDTAETVDWTIVPGSLSVNPLSVGPGTTASLTAGTFTTNSYGYPVGWESFSLSSLSLGPGTYYLILQNAVTAESAPLFWDENNGPSTAYEESAYGPLADFSDCQQGGVFAGGTCSEAFNIVGTTTTTTPEPGTLALLGTFLFMAARRRRAS